MWHRLRNTEETQRGQDPEHQVGNQENLTFSSILYTRTRSASSSPLVIPMNSKVFGCNRGALLVSQRKQCGFANGTMEESFTWEAT